ncbi:MAG: hypothetical protein ACRDK2_03745 [Solirubrobacteraceae bacterium]
MSSPRHRLLFVVLAVCAMLTLGACGQDSRVTTGTYAGESGVAAPYLNVGPLVYQVQLSRQLNPDDTEDASYLGGLTPQQRKLAPGEEWFAVFLQVYNHAKQAYPTASALSISDTQGNEYRPVIPDQSNPFAYRATELAGGEQIPGPNTIASSGPTQGALLLYKIKVVSLDNRPLELRIVDPSNPSQMASAELDV